MNENKNNEVILIGLPNSGKSTLINTLSKNKTSIVGSKPNTTRDKVSKKSMLTIWKLLYQIYQDWTISQIS